MVNVPSVSASDVGSGLMSLTVTATSNEPDTGDGDTANDIAITGSGLGPYGVQLRAERGGLLVDRVYAITIAATDMAGLTTSSSVSCTVPHDQGK
jgi:hypothetical protein